MSKIQNNVPNFQKQKPTAPNKQQDDRHSEIEQANLRFTQISQTENQTRQEMFNTQTRFDLLVRMLEEKGIMANGEFQKRWPLYLKNVVGVADSDGIMRPGKPKVTFYGNKKKEK
jgi:predicted transcriptional regulator YheO